jgi:hypothetical protein
MMIFIECISFTIREGTWQHTKDFDRFDLHRVLIVFIQGNLSTIREGIWRFPKRFWSILIALSPDCIYWRCVFPQNEKEHDRLRKASSILLAGRLMIFIEWVFFLDKRRNMTVYERHMIDFISRETDDFHWRRSIHGKEKIWNFTKFSFSIFLARSLDGIYWRIALPP